MTMTMMARAVIFDWGGVLMRTVDEQPRRALEAQYGLAQGSVEKLVFGSPLWGRCQKGELSDEEFWAKWGQQRGLASEATTDLRRRFFIGDQLDEALVVFIRSLRPRLKTALLSNFSACLRDLLAEYNLGDAFDAVVISAEEGVVKPEARIYQIACQRLNVLPSQAVLVDDFIENVEGARRAGLGAIHFVSAAQAIAALRQMFDM